MVRLSLLPATTSAAVIAALLPASSSAFQLQSQCHASGRSAIVRSCRPNSPGGAAVLFGVSDDSDCDYVDVDVDVDDSAPSRRRFLSRFAAASLGSGAAAAFSSVADPSGVRLGGGPAVAVGPVKIDILNPVYTAAPCPPSKPIPGEKAMKGMRGLCVKVTGELAELPPKELVDAGVYGFVNDAVSSESVLANNPDGGTDAGQFTMIEGITNTKDKKVEFEFVAAVPMEKNVAQYEDGIGPLSFRSLRIISFPGGQQFGAISPCEFNEFSDECEAWETENGPYKKAAFMIKSNARTKGR